MRIQKFNVKFMPKYQLLLGLNVYMQQTFDIETKKYYDGVDIEFGLGLLVVSIVLLKKRKGAE